MSPAALGPALALLALGWAAPFKASAAGSPAEYRRQARERLAAEDYEAAYALVERALELAPHDPESLALRLKVEARGGTRFARWLALEDAEKRASAPGLAGPRLAAALIETGRLRLLIGDFEGAERDFARALALDPESSAASSGLASALRERPEKALPYAERAAQTAASDRERAVARRLAGEIRLDLGDAAGARADFTRSLKYGGDELETLHGMVLALEGDPGAARAYAARAAKAAASAPAWHRAAAYRFAARIWLEAGAYDEAEASLRRALDIDPDDLDALETLSRVRWERPKGRAAASVALPGAEKKEEERPLALADAAAAERFEKEIPGLPLWQRADAERALAKALLSLGDRRRAKRALRRAEELEPRSLSTALLLESIEPDDPDAEEDLAEAREAAASARAALLKP